MNPANILILSFVIFLMFLVFMDTKQKKDNYQLEIKKMELELQMKQEETKRLQLLKNTINFKIEE